MTEAKQLGLLNDNFCKVEFNYHPDLVLYLNYKINHYYHDGYCSDPENDYEKEFKVKIYSTIPLHIKYLTKKHIKRIFNEKYSNYNDIDSISGVCVDHWSRDLAKYVKLIDCDIIPRFHVETNIVFLRSLFITLFKRHVIMFFILIYQLVKNNKNKNTNKKQK